MWIGKAVAAEHVNVRACSDAREKCRCDLNAIAVSVGRGGCVVRSSLRMWSSAVLRVPHPSREKAIVGESCCITAISSSRNPFKSSVYAFVNSA